MNKKQRVEDVSNNNKTDVYKDVVNVISSKAYKKDMIKYIINTLAYCF